MRVVALTGAGISADSGVATYRDSGGLWEGVSFEDVATPQAWARDPAFVWAFYQKRRAQMAAGGHHDADPATAGQEAPAGRPRNLRCGNGNHRHANDECKNPAPHPEILQALKHCENAISVVVL